MLPKTGSGGALNFRSGSINSLWALWLMVAVPLTAVASCPYAPLPEPAKSSQEATTEPSGTTETASASPQAAAEAERPAWVSPALVNKKVVVYLRDGRVYKGKLVELTDDFLRLKMRKRTEKIALTEVGSVERKRSRAWLGVAIAGLAIGAVAVAALIAAMQD